MEGLFVLLGAVIMLGPILWALSVGWRGGPPENEDEAGLTAYGELLRRVLIGGRKG